MNNPILKFLESLTGNQSPKILPTSDRLRQEILITIKDDKKKLGDMQNILKGILYKYDVSGFVVYSELRDMISEGILEIDNDELDNESVISGKKNILVNQS